MNRRKFWSALVGVGGGATALATAKPEPKKHTMTLHLQFDREKFNEEFINQIRANYRGVAEAIAQGIRSRNV